MTFNSNRNHKTDDLTKCVSGTVEISSFDGQPVFCARQRWELFEQSLVNAYWCELESERYAVHTVFKPKVRDWSFETEVVGVPF